DPLDRRHHERDLRLHENVVAADRAALLPELRPASAQGFAPADLGNRAEFRTPNSESRSTRHLRPPARRKAFSPGIDRTHHETGLPAPAGSRRAQRWADKPVAATRTQRSQSAVGKTSGP